MHIYQKLILIIISLLILSNNLCICTFSKNNSILMAYEATKTNDVGKLKDALSADIDLNVLVQEKHENDGILPSFTVLTKAVYNRCSSEFLKRIIEAGADINKTNTDGIVAIHIAAQQPNIEAFNVLLDYEANVDIIDSRGYTAVSYAIENSHEPSLLEKLFKAKAKLEWEGGSALDYAVKRGHRMEAIKTLFDGDRKVSLESRNIDERTPLLEAVRLARLDEAKFLLEKGANPNVKDKEGVTPLGYAAYLGHCRLASILLNYRADHTILTASGKSILQLAREPNMLACKSGQQEIIRLISRV